MKKITLFVLFFFFLFSGQVFAQDAKSNTERIKFGNPPTPPISSTVVGAAQAIKSAYDGCASGFTQETSGLGTCLRQQLLSAGYSEAVLDAFETRRRSGIADGCTQCLGFVGLVLTLLSGSTSTLVGIPSAKDVLNSTTITAGSLLFEQIPSTEPIQPGDIGVSGGGTWGHILLVNTIEGNIKFSALESNGNFDCRITDSRMILKELYTFYRQK